MHEVILISIRAKKISESSWPLAGEWELIRVRATSKLNTCTIGMVIYIHISHFKVKSNKLTSTTTDWEKTPVWAANAGAKDATDAMHSNCTTYSNTMKKSQHYCHFYTFSSLPMSIPTTPIPKATLTEACQYHTSGSTNQRRAKRKERKWLMLMVCVGKTKWVPFAVTGSSWAAYVVKWKLYLLTIINFLLLNQSTLQLEKNAVYNIL